MAAKHVQASMPADDQPEVASVADKAAELDRAQLRSRAAGFSMDQMGG